MVLVLVRRQRSSGRTFGESAKWLFARVKTPIVIFLVVVCGALVVDSLLPTEELDSDVHHFLKNGDVLAYIVPLTGGELDTCSIAGKELQAVKVKTKISVQRTPIFGRCVDIKPIRCISFVCSSGTHGTIDADTFFRNAIHYAYGERYSNLSELMKDFHEYHPQIRQWPTVRLWVPVRYSVRLPEEIVIVNEEGNVQTSRKCGSSESYC